MTAAVNLGPLTADVPEGKNLMEAAVAASVPHVIGECGGYSQTPGKILCGGGMTGLCCPNDDIPMTKATNGVVVFNEHDAKSVEEQPCIRCGRCVEACPMGLNPYQIKHYCDADNLKAAAEHDVNDCILCGCCSYACPARRWLTASFKNAKEKIAIAAKRGKA